MQFLLFLAAFLKGVDEYQDLLRSTVAYAGNDHRLGANEAPPAIISIFLGDELEAVVNSIINGTDYTDPGKSIMRIGVDVLPSIPKDTTDRNRTSPVAFTGNKFEFRMLGSSQSIAGPNIVLNTIVAEELQQFADVLENADDFDSALQKLVCETLTNHKRIIFNGNGYSEEWQQEAAQRGLSNLPCTATALPAYTSRKNIDLVTRHGIYTETEFHARYEIHLEAYNKIMRIEAKTMVDMVMHEILPAALRYASDLTAGIVNKRNALGADAKFLTESVLANRISECCDRLYENSEKLYSDIKHVPAGNQKAADYYSNVIVADMQAVRKDADFLEKLTAKSYWPYPQYSDILFY